MKMPFQSIGLTAAYTGLSMFLGPLLFILGMSLTRGGGDYCDPVYELADGSINPLRETEFRNAQLVQAGGAAIMLAFGLFIITLLVIDLRQKRSLRAFAALLITLLVMVGYILIILLSGKGGQNC